MAEAGAAAGALDQAGHVGDGHAAFVTGVRGGQVEDAQVGHECRERVGRHLGRGRGERGKKR